MLAYVHVPFCVSKCRYCAFHSGLFRAEDARRYLELVVAELSQWAEVLGNRRVHSVYFGGGTPSLLDAGQIGRMVEAVSRCFVLDADAEITVEANPESAVRPGLLEELRRIGVNRLSLGVQSMRDEMLRLLGRPHDSGQARLALTRARDAGFANVSLDLIWGLPRQTVAQWLEDVAACIALEPEHLSAYGLTLESGTALARQVQEGDFSVPNDEELAQMYLRGIDLLESSGLMQYEVSNFARSGKESRHNCGYWSGESYLGLGPSAVSTLDGRRWVNPATLDAYDALIRRGLGKRDEEDLSAEIRRREEIMLSLRTREGLDLSKFMAKDGIGLDPELFAAVERLRSSGLVRLESDRIHLTRSGMLVSNSIIELVLDLTDRLCVETGNL